MGLDPGELLFLQVWIVKQPRDFKISLTDHIAIEFAGDCKVKCGARSFQIPCTHLFECCVVIESLILRHQLNSAQARGGGVRMMTKVSLHNGKAVPGQSRAWIKLSPAPVVSFGCKEILSRIDVVERNDPQTNGFGRLIFYLIRLFDSISSIHEVSGGDVGGCKVIARRGKILIKLEGLFIQDDSIRILPLGGQEARPGVRLERLERAGAHRDKWRVETGDTAARFRWANLPAFSLHNSLLRA